MKVNNLLDIARYGDKSTDDVGAGKYIPYHPSYGEIVMVANGLPLPEGNIFFAQKFVVFHNGLYFCERDDGCRTKLEGWKFCIKNQGHDLHFERAEPGTEVL